MEKRNQTKFVTQYQNWYHNVSESGNVEEPIYERFVDEVTKQVSLRQVGTRNIYEEIQEAGVGTTFKEMLAKYENGMITAEQLGIGRNYDVEDIDISNLPDNFVDMQNYINDVEKNVNVIKDELDKVNNFIRNKNESEKNESENDDLKEENKDE